MRTRSFSLALLTVAGLAGCANDVVAPTASMSATPSSAAKHGGGSSSQVIVTESDVSRQAEDTPPLRNWVIYTRPASPGTATFRNGPGTPPLGTGSIEFSTPLPTSKVYMFNFDHVGAAISGVDAMSYWTYRTAGTGQQVTALNMQVDANGAAPGGFTTLVFEPVYNPTQGAVVNGTWQHWDAYQGGNAIWWSTRPIAGVCAFSCYVTWNQIVAANPNAVIVGGFGFNQGSGNPGLIAADDALTLGINGTTTTWNFELYRTPQTKDDCKKGGWQTVTRSDGTPFKNQGDCVSYTNHQ